MPLDPEVAHALERTAAGGWLPLTGGTVAEARRSYRELSLIRRGDGYVPEAVADVEDVTVDGPAGVLPARVYAPVDPTDAVIVFLHGGGWVIGDLDTHDPVCRSLANATRATVASIEYRLAPEAPYPAALDDAMAALRWAARRWPSHRLAVAGDSAGGGLAAGAALRARDEPDGPPIAAQLLIYPAVDPRMNRPSVAENAEGYFLSRADMAWFYGHYLSTPGIEADPYLAPLERAELAGAPPAVVAVAEFDPLRDEGTEYARALATAGVPVTLLHGAGLTHGWVGMAELSGAARREAAEAFAAFAALIAP